MKDKTNGSSMNGSGKPHDPEDKIVHFPTLADRDRARKEKEAQEKKGRMNTRTPNAPVPFLNLSKIPPFTRYMVAFLVLVQVGLSFTDEATRYQVFYIFGFVPAYFSGSLQGVTPLVYSGPVTHMFIHGGWMHLAFNTITLLTFGILFERAFGARRMAIFWLLCGFAGAGVYFALNPNLATPVIGASGSISGLFAAAILLIHERGQMPGMGSKGPWPIIGFWLVFMVVTGMLSGDNTAWQAHAGGFICGILLYRVYKSKIRAPF